MVGILIIENVELSFYPTSSETKISLPLMRMKPYRRTGGPFIFTEAAAVAKGAARPLGYFSPLLIAKRASSWIVGSQAANKSCLLVVEFGKSSKQEARMYRDV